LGRVRQQGIASSTGKIGLGTVHFTKMSGSGNDFIFIDNRSGAIGNDSAPALARSLCRHRVSVGADGIVLLSDPPAGSPVAYRWRYINADGSDGELCGNASMCSARFAFRHGLAGPHHSFLTDSGVIEAWADASTDQVMIAMPDTSGCEDPIALAVRGRTLVATPITVGVPHCVIQVDDADGFADTPEFEAIGREIRHHPAFAPAGTNVNVISPLENQVWRMRTYERGVERETLACGTGVVACSVVLAKAGLTMPPVSVKVSGGNSLRATFAVHENGASDVRLSGSATFVYDADLDPEALV
jgi:diaminopimelate epimerase